MGSRARGRAATRSVLSVREAAHSDGAGGVAVLAEHPSSIGAGKVLPKSTTDDDEVIDAHRRAGLINGSEPIRDLRLPIGNGRERLAASPYDVAFRYWCTSPALVWFASAA